jgi:hypothetical protein
MICSVGVDEDPLAEQQVADRSALSAQRVYTQALIKTSEENQRIYQTLARRSYTRTRRRKRSGER